MIRIFAVVALATLPACFWMFHFHHDDSVKDEGITSPTHRAHVGGFVFAPSYIGDGNEDPSRLTDHCVVGQPCAARFYLPKSLGASAHDRNASGYTLRAIVDGVAAKDETGDMSASSSTAGFVLMRGPDDTSGNIHVRWFLDNVVTRLAPGDHTVELTVFAHAPQTEQPVGKPIATGRLILTAPANTRSVVARMKRTEDDLEAADRSAANSSNSTDSSDSSCNPVGALARDNMDCCSGRVRDIGGNQLKCCDDDRSDCH